MLGKLAPVGSRISLQKRVDANWEALYPGVDTKFYCSGTAALAAAMSAAKSLTAFSGEREVILPAYGCPDLVSAAVFAGLKPVLVDLERNSPNMSLTMVEEAISSKTVAIVAVNFLGVPERLECLKALAVTSGLVLIEDNAQWFPQPGCKLYGDFIITSFGRGKPVSVLGGGLLLTKKSINCEVSEPLKPDYSGRFLLAKLIAHNILITPFFYGIIESLPIFSLGTTRYKVLKCIAGMPAANRARLAQNVDIHLNCTTEVQKKIRSVVNSFADYLIDITNGIPVNSSNAYRLLRYPILTRSEADRGILLASFRKAGLGASGLYDKPLTAIEGVENKVRLHSNIEQAKSFAARLITLPTHAMMTEQHLVDLELVLSNHFR